MAWLLILGVLIYLMLAIISDGLDALLLWTANHPGDFIQSVRNGLIVGVMTAVFKGHVTATIYIFAGTLAGLANLIYKWIRSHEPD